MDLGYSGEITTPSQCGRMDQCCAFGARPVQMIFDGDRLDCEEFALNARARAAARTCDARMLPPALCASHRNAAQEEQQPASEGRGSRGPSGWWRLCRVVSSVGGACARAASGDHLSRDRRAGGEQGHDDHPAEAQQVLPRRREAGGARPAGTARAEGTQAHAPRVRGAKRRVAGRAAAAPRRVAQPGATRADA
eukprot:3634668-Prymnesium_polylepis.1